MAHPITKQRPGSGAHASAIASLEHHVRAHPAARAGSGATAKPPTLASARQDLAGTGAPHRRGGSGAAKG
jgi:hypothetical protein